ncbi:hypothetical protein C8R44DRAFT_740702 [Mycena epipterygia]|nr:hypothetical protein C8R44DRAFT_740702 [Mycena epipterygia]
MRLTFCVSPSSPTLFSETFSNDNDGIAQYVHGATAGLAYTSGSQVILVVDDTPSASPRKSAHSKTTFNAKNNNLFIFDIAHIPAVCGTWPAVWLTGTDWPYDGKIDVVEAANLYTRNVYSLHTGPGCTISSSTISVMKNVQIVKVGATNCGGGVFALEFDTEGTKRWFWKVGSMPADITALSETYFKDLLLVVNTNLAGVAAGCLDLFADNVGGQTQSCQTQTGVSTAAGYVTAHGAGFGAAAQWSPNADACGPYNTTIGTYDGTSNFSAACVVLTEACLSVRATNIWSHASCVAAATCQGTAGIIALNQCQNPDVLPAASIPNLSSAQNYIDFVYGVMTDAGVTTWPSSANDVLAALFEFVNAG